MDRGPWILRDRDPASEKTPLRTFRRIMETLAVYRAEE
jgi:hypothetical protein